MHVIRLAKRLQLSTSFDSSAGCRSKGHFEVAEWLGRVGAGDEERDQYFQITCELDTFISVDVLTYRMLECVLSLEQYPAILCKC